MKKRILPILLAAVLCAVLMWPVSVSAAQLDTEADASLTLYYQTGGKAFPGLQIQVFRVAEAYPDGSFALIEPYSAYPVNIYDITQQSQWQDIATTLSAYMVADQVKPDREMVTDSQGIAAFEDLETGLYLVNEVIARDDDGIYTFNTFMVYVPTPQSDGTYNYRVEAKPKCTQYVPMTQYTVTKLWQDEGHQNARPKEVTVDIYMDGVLLDTQILKPENNWTYTWQVMESSAKWTVAERVTSDAYKVTIRQNGNVFSIINTTEGDSGTPPKTGDMFTPLPLILVMCFSGAMLVILGCYGRRRR